MLKRARERARMASAGPPTGRSENARRPVLAGPHGRRAPKRPLLAGQNGCSSCDLLDQGIGDTNVLPRPKHNIYRKSTLVRVREGCRSLAMFELPDLPYAYDALEPVI